ncbi:fertility inhibition FinO-like protein [Phormidesmis priestleyi ULC007]|uniref:Fertility inhibition FinO-like protein n=1 Tax=Phormidesmis priestleyi ULC007 TaxID=1920490 RepID=A0A2T1D2A3_9CYAN|nr:fertility inhibition FinO-like protein [Phormidesmis priestleyi]PSB14534.1 fertility inhibition FinO-like protein [Phormidesmis priestleyi ULC007]
MPVNGKLELTIKISEFPSDVKTENNLKTFEIDCDGQIVSVTLKPKMFKKLEDAQTNFPMWVAANSFAAPKAFAGKMGQPTGKGFVLAEANIQVFEKKPKEPAAG